MFSIPSLAKLVRQLIHRDEPKVEQPTEFLCEVCSKAISSRHDPASIIESNGHHQVTFECRELSACELYPHGLPNAYQEWDVTRKDESFDLEPKPGVDKDPEAS